MFLRRLLLIPVAAALAAGCSPRRVDLPAIGVIPPFALTERDGRTVSRADLEGRVWIADFIFTRCSGVCPMMTSKMTGLQKSLAERAASGEFPKDRLRLVSITVDPDYDTPAVLSAYAREAGADPLRWLFLTGREQDIFDLSQKGFLLAAGRDEAAAARFGGTALTHSEKFTLVDSRGVVRGYYDSGDAGEMRKLIEDAAALAREAA